MLIRYSRLVSRLKTQTTRYHLTLGFSTSTPTEEEPALSGPPPIRVALTERAGRGVFATRDIAARELIHTDKPLVSHPSFSTVGKVCYHCLKRLDSTRNRKATRVGFCSEECEDAAKVFSDVEPKADLSEFDEYCRTQGLKYPLLVKRFACMVIAGAVSAESLNIIQPAILSNEMVLEGHSDPRCSSSEMHWKRIHEEVKATMDTTVPVVPLLGLKRFRIHVVGGVCC